MNQPRGTDAAHVGTSGRVQPLGSVALAPGGLSPRGARGIFEAPGPVFAGGEGCRVADAAIAGRVYRQRAFKAPQVSVLVGVTPKGSTWT